MKSSFNPWPYGIMAFFVLLFGWLVTLVVIASTHRESLVSESYYEQEMKFQDRMESTARAQQAGATIQLNAPSGKLVVAVPAQQLAAKLSGNIEFYRPSDPALDCQFALSPKNDGTQAVDVSQLAAGLWQVRVQWNAAGKNYFLEQKITL